LFITIYETVRDTDLAPRDKKKRQSLLTVTAYRYVV